jgi:hypothetical protein
MKSYLLKRSDREEGPFTEMEVAQMFADQKVDRYTPCKPNTGTDWKTIDDFMPMLKYGTQLPPPTPTAAVSAAPPLNQIAPAAPNVAPVVVPANPERIAIIDIDIPFGSLLKLMFKWAAAAFIVGVCFIPAAIVIWLIFMALLAGLVGGAFSIHHP